MFKKSLSLITIVCFFLTTLGPFSQAHADSVLGLPAPGTMVSVSPSFEPALIKGLTVHKDNPFLFDFIVDPGQGLRGQSVIASAAKQSFKDESLRMIKYFFAALTIPDKDIWVNLSPYEKDRMIPVSLGKTVMGRDLLAQDYMLKQLTASLIYPQKALGKTFWDKVYSKAKATYGTTQIPVNTFNKVWIVPQEAGVYEHGQTAFIVSGHLKVMLEEDYLALNKHVSLRGGEADAAIFKRTTNDTHAISSQIIRTIILPEIEKEINEGKNFATLRQIFYAQVLAVWFKRNLKQALLNRVYANKGTVKGIDQNDAATNEAIYHQYLQAYKKGVFNYIQEDINPATQETLPRKYFSGGYGNAAMLTLNHASLPEVEQAAQNGLYRETVAVETNRADAEVLARNVAEDAAMTTMKYDMVNAADQVIGLEDLRVRRHEIEESVNHDAIHILYPTKDGQLRIIGNDFDQTFKRVTALSVADNGQVFLAYYDNGPQYVQVYRNSAGHIRADAVYPDMMPTRIKQEWGLEPVVDMSPKRLISKVLTIEEIKELTLANPIDFGHRRRAEDYIDAFAQNPPKVVDGLTGVNQEVANRILYLKLLDTAAVFSGLQVQSGGIRGKIRNPIKELLSKLIATDEFKALPVTDDLTGRRKWVVFQVGGAHTIFFDGLPDWVEKEKQQPRIIATTNAAMTGAEMARIKDQLKEKIVVTREGVEIAGKAYHKHEIGAVLEWLLTTWLPQKHIYTKHDFTASPPRELEPTPDNQFVRLAHHIVNLDRLEELRWEFIKVLDGVNGLVYDSEVINGPPMNYAVSGLRVKGTPIGDETFRRIEEVLIAVKEIVADAAMLTKDMGNESLEKARLWAAAGGDRSPFHIGGDWATNEGPFKAPIAHGLGIIDSALAQIARAYPDFRIGHWAVRSPQKIGNPRHVTGGFRGMSGIIRLTEPTALKVKFDEEVPTEDDTDLKLDFLVTKEDGSEILGGYVIMERRDSWEPEPYFLDEREQQRRLDAFVPLLSQMTAYPVAEPVWHEKSKIFDVPNTWPDAGSPLTPNGVVTQELLDLVAALEGVEGPPSDRFLKSTFLNFANPGFIPGGFEVVDYGRAPIRIGDKIFIKGRLDREKEIPAKTLEGKPTTLMTYQFNGYNQNGELVFVFEVDYSYPDKRPDSAKQDGAMTASEKRIARINDGLVTVSRIKDLMQKISGSDTKFDLNPSLALRISKIDGFSPFALAQNGWASLIGSGGVPFWLLKYEHKFGYKPGVIMEQSKLMDFFANLLEKDRRVARLLMWQLAGLKDEAIGQEAIERIKQMSDESFAERVRHVEFNLKAEKNRIDKVLIDKIKELLGGLNVYYHESGDYGDSFMDTTYQYTGQVRIEWRPPVEKYTSWALFNPGHFKALVADLFEKDPALAKELISSITVDPAMLNANKAALANVAEQPWKQGGIDLSQQDAALHVEKDANGGVKVDVDPALIARIEREGMPEVIPVIINMQPADIKSLFGVETAV